MPDSAWAGANWADIAEQVGNIVELKKQSQQNVDTDHHGHPVIAHLITKCHLQIAENWFPEGKQKILPGQMGESVVTGMRPWAVYQLRVFAENQLGKSKEGKVLQVGGWQLLGIY